jgi:transcriptional regulator with XRE-family HTH domain
MNVIGPQVREIRDSQGLTQEALAARCEILKWNVSRSTLAKIESQVRRVTDEEVALLAKALKVKITRLYP